MPDPTFTAAPAVVPSRAVPSTFSALTDPFLVWEKTFRGELSSSVSWFALQVTNSQQAVTDATAQVALAADEVVLATAQVALAADEVGLAAGQVTLATAQVALAADEVVLAAAQVTLADAAAEAAVITANAAAWVSEASYSAGANAISGVDFGTYRAILTHTGVATDPSADATNWVLISAPAKASQAEAEAGTDNAKFLTPLRTAQAIAELSPGLTTTATTGASQSIDFSSNKIVTSTANAATVTYSFTSPAAVAKVDLIIDYQVATSFDLSTASYDSVEFSVASQDSSTQALAFSSDGTKMFVVGGTGDSVFQYTLSTGFDLSTASYDSVSFSVDSQDAAPAGLAFNSDGTKMFMLGASSGKVFQYTLSTSFDLSTASYDSVEFSVNSQETAPTGLAFNSDGTKMYVIGSTSDKVFQYTLSTGFNLSTASYDSVEFSVASQESSPRSLAFNSDGTKMYIVGIVGASVYQYSTSAGATLVFPTLQGPTIPLSAGRKTAVTIVTADGGTSYQVISTLGGIE